MKKKIVLSLITICVLSFASCGNNTTETSETTVSAETTVEAIPEPTVTPEPTATPTPTPDVDNPTTSESQSKSEINENDSQTSEGDVYEEVTETPAPEVKPSNNSYSLDEESKAFLKQMGATDAELNSIKSDKDLENLINSLANRLYGNGGGSSNTGGGSSSASGDLIVDPSDRGETAQLLPADQTLPGSM